MLNDYDTTWNVNESLEKGKSILSMVSPAADFQEICGIKPYWLTFATPTINHGAKLIFVSWLSRTDNGYINKADFWVFFIPKIKSSSWYNNQISAVNL